MNMKATTNPEQQSKAETPTPLGLNRAALLAELGGEGDIGALVRLLANRYSCRGYRADPVPRETIEQVLKTAQLSPSWCNSQPWELIITEGSSTEAFRNAMYDYATEHHGSVRETDFPFPEEYVGRFKDRQRRCGLQLYQAVGVARGDRQAGRQQALENFRLFGAPHVAILTTERALGVYGAIDCGIYLGSLLLAMESRGIGAIPQASIAMMAPFVRDYFNIGDDRMIVCAVSFGFPDQTAAANTFRTERAELGEVVSWR